MRNLFVFSVLIAIAVFIYSCRGHDAIPCHVTCLNLPVDNSTVHEFRPSFAWDSVPGAVKYHFQICLTNVFDDLFVNDSSLQHPYYRQAHNWYDQNRLDAIGPHYVSGTHYYWRVRAKLATHTWTEWSNVSQFDMFDFRDTFATRYDSVIVSGITQYWNGSGSSTPMGKRTVYVTKDSLSKGVRITIPGLFNNVLFKDLIPYPDKGEGLEYGDYITVGKVEFHTNGGAIYGKYIRDGFWCGCTTNGYEFSKWIQ